MQYMIKKIYYFITEYLMMFILASFMGWAYEVICTSIVWGRYAERGVLRSPICPIYGVGMLVLYPLLRKAKNPLLIFGESALITTIIELITSYAAEKFFNTELWNYSEWPLNYEGRISLLSSAVFGLMAVVFFLLIKPAVDKCYSSSKGKLITSTAVMLAVIVFAVLELTK